GDTLPVSTVGRSAIFTAASAGPSGTGLEVPPLGPDGAGAASPFPPRSAFTVAGPALPSTSSLLAFWNAFTAATKSLPGLPSCSTPSAFCIAFTFGRPSPRNWSRPGFRYDQCHGSDGTSFTQP